MVIQTLNKCFIVYSVILEIESTVLIHFLLIILFKVMEELGKVHPGWLFSLRCMEKDRSRFKPRTS